MSRRLFTILALAASSAVTMLTFSGPASAEAYVSHANYRDSMTNVVTEIYNSCDLSQGVDSPKLTITGGSYMQQATITYISDLHVMVTMHGVTEFQGVYPDGTHVTGNSTINVTETANVDPSSLATGELKLTSALTTTFVVHDAIHVAGTSIPDGTFQATVAHATFTPDLKLVSLVYEDHSGC